VPRPCEESRVRLLDARLGGRLEVAHSLNALPASSSTGNLPSRPFPQAAAAPARQGTTPLRPHNPGRPDHPAPPGPPGASSRGGATCLSVGAGSRGAGEGEGGGTDRGERGAKARRRGTTREGPGTSLPGPGRPREAQSTDKSWMSDHFWQLPLHCTVASETGENI
jgi:hypothetical protein